MRKVVIRNKKIRGTPRHLRFLARWAQSWSGCFPEVAPENESRGYWSQKIPVPSSLVQGRRIPKQIRALCAQHLIDAAFLIAAAKPVTRRATRVTCCVVLPDMFSSEITIFAAENYWDLHTQPGAGRFGEITRLEGISLRKNWNLQLPEGFSELGVLRTDIDDEGRSFQIECWYFGEVR